MATKIEPAVGGADLSDVDVEIADRGGLELRFIPLPSPTSGSREMRGLEGSDEAMSG